MRRSVGLDAWWDEPAYRVGGTFKARGYFILRKLHELDPDRFNTVMTQLYPEEERAPQDITKTEWKVILEHMGASPEEIKDVQVKMGKWR
jgi:hypothetical protein